jgi:hypothetical protein
VYVNASLLQTLRIRGIPIRYDGPDASGNPTRPAKRRPRPCICQGGFHAHLGSDVDDHQILAHLHARRSCVVAARRSPRYQDYGRLPLRCRHSAEFLRESDEKPLRPADVAEPICLFILDDFAYELRTALAKPLERVVDVIHGKHDPQVP